MNALGTLVRFRLRRERIITPVWVLVIAASVLFVAAALADTYGTHDLRVSVIGVIGTDPTVLALRGAPDGASAGSFFMMEIGSYLLLLAAFMNTFLAVRHTRADEEQGRSDLVVATRAGRGSSTLATVIVAVIANVLVGVFSALAAMAAGYDGAGSVVLGWALATTGIAFFGIGLLSAQIFSTSRGANGWAVAAIGVLWVLNSAGNAASRISADRLHATPGAAVWFTPIGWALRTRPFTANEWWPGLLSVGLAVVLVVVAFVLQSVRDTSAGLIAPRAGRATASSALRGPLGLAWRLQRGSIIGWGIGAVVAAFLVGGLGKTLQDVAAGNPDVSKVIKNMAVGSGTVFDAFVGVMMGLVGLLVAGAAIQTAMRLRQEEAGSTAETVLATPVSRLRWYLSYVVLALVASLVILGVSGLLAGLALSNIDTGLIGQAFALALGQLPAVAVYLAITAVVFALVPRATIAVGWTVFGLGVIVGEFGSLLGLPEWLRDLAPSSNTATAPLEHADWSGTWIMALIVVVVVAAGAWAFSRRGIVSSS